MTTEKDEKKARRNYKDASGKKLPGVTTILGVLDKPGLLYWASRLAAEATAAAIVDGGHPAPMAIEIGRKTPFAKRDKAADLGTLAHACVEAHYAGEPWPDAPDSAKACADRVITHIAKAGYVVVASEWSSTWGEHGYGFAGTLDLVVQRDGILYIADLKTGSLVDSVVPQLGAYRMLWNRHNADKALLSGVVFHARVDGTEVKEVRLSQEKLDAGFNIFYAAKQIYWARKDAKLPDTDDREEVEE